MMYLLFVSVSLFLFNYSSFIEHDLSDFQAIHVVHKSHEFVKVALLFWQVDLRLFIPPWRFD